jgi:hypothetical protein
VVLSTPPIDAISSVIMPVTTAKITGVRVWRADCRSSRIQMGLGSCTSRCRPQRQRANAPALVGGGSDGVWVCTLIADRRG